MQGELTSYSGRCHCGAVRFEVRTTLRLNIGLGSAALYAPPLK